MRVRATVAAHGRGGDKGGERAKGRGAERKRRKKIVKGIMSKNKEERE